jgi:hypothetical protein
MKIYPILIIAALVWMSGLGRAQATPPHEDRIELGQTLELQGVRTVCVDTGPNVSEKRVIVERLQKKLPTLRLADRPEEAEVVLEFRPDREYCRVPGQGHIYIGGGTHTPIYTGVDIAKPASWMEYFGSGLVYRRVAADRIRVLVDYSGDNPAASRDHHPRKFTDTFVKAWRKANGK